MISDNIGSVDANADADNPFVFFMLQRGRERWGDSHGKGSSSQSYLISDVFFPEATPLVPPGLSVLAKCLCRK